MPNLMSKKYQPMAEKQKYLKIAEESKSQQVTTVVALIACNKDVCSIQEEL